MKLNTRSIAVLAGLGAVVAANAAPAVSFYLGYGDATFASLNGKNVGDALSTTAINKIPTAFGGSFTVSVFVLNTGTNTGYVDGFSSGALFVGYGSATRTFKDYNSSATPQADAEADMSSPFSIDTTNDSAGYNNPGTVSERKSNNTGIKNTSITSQSDGFYTSALPTDGVSSGVSGLRSIGVGNAIHCDSGYRFTLPTGTPVRLYDLSFINKATITGAFGPLGTGNGLSLNNFTGPAANNNGNNNNFLNGASQLLGDGKVYTVGAAVPEPSTIFALAAGVAVMARRRRK